MADSSVGVSGLIPGLDGNLPNERSSLPDSFVMKKNTSGDASNHDASQSSAGQNSPERMVGFEST